jgi:hypothetical protein
MSEYTGRPRPIAVVGGRGAGDCAILFLASKRRNRPEERKHENRKHTFGRTVSGTFGGYVDDTRLRSATRRLWGGRWKVSSSGPSAISDRPRIRGHEEQPRACLQVLHGGPWLPSLVVPIAPRQRRKLPRRPNWHRPVRRSIAGASGTRGAADGWCGVSCTPLA